jgi:septal ring factor EnvC (AmiA/AmiB activator)
VTVEQDIRHRHARLDPDLMFISDGEQAHLDRAWLLAQLGPLRDALAAADQRANQAASTFAGLREMIARQMGVIGDLTRERDALAAGLMDLSAKLADAKADLVEIPILDMIEPPNGG